LEELAKEQKRKATKRNLELKEAGVDSSDTIGKQEDSAASMLEFLEAARSGQIIPPDVIIRYAKYFQDDLTLDNMPRMQLINLCKYMGIPPYGSEAFLQFQLRHRIRVLKEDDQRILWEGIDSLTKMELREACQERGMRSTGLSKDAYKRALQQWLELSLEKKVPISLLIMSRTFFLREDMFERKADNGESQSLAGLADAISGLDQECVNEVILEVATSEEKRSDPDVRKIKLEVLSKQNELIRQEEEAREAAKKREREKAEAQAAAEEMTEPLASAVAETPTEFTVPVDNKDTKVEGESEKEFDLSSHEMDAISQLVSDDPVSKERAELQRIKEAMKSEIAMEIMEAEPITESPYSTTSEGVAVESTSSAEPMTSEEADRIACAVVEEMDAQAKAESAESTSMSIAMEGADTPEVEEEEPEDPVVARLKKRIESMVNKIEVQLSETEVKIGDKLHFLDKDKDGILTQEEMAEALMHALKRKISFEEALEIANEMVSGAFLRCLYACDIQCLCLFDGFTHDCILLSCRMRTEMACLRWKS
jgi:LETM1 and EF-hand domain-containing protein 1